MRVGLSELLQRCMDEVLRAAEDQDLKSVDQVIAYLMALDEALREAADALPVLRYALGMAWRAHAEVAVSAAAYDTAAAFFSEAAEGHAEDDPRRGAYRMQAGETLIAKFDHSEDLKDVDDAVAVLRTAFTEVSRTAEAPGESSRQPAGSGTLSRTGLTSPRTLRRWARASACCVRPWTIALPRSRSGGALCWPTRCTYTGG